VRYKFAGPAERLVRFDDLTDGSLIMKWETPAAAEIRFGFEITMYVANR